MALLIPEARPLARTSAPGSNRDQLTVRRAVPADHDELARFVRDLSPDSTHSRFLSGLGNRVPDSMVVRLLTGGPGGGALVAVVAGQVVGHALWARSGAADAPVAEIALVVADAYQRRGIGSMLVDRVQAEMLGCGIERVQVVTSGANRPVLSMLARRNPDLRPIAFEGPTLTYEVTLEEPQWPASRPGPDYGQAL